MRIFALILLGMSVSLHAKVYDCMTFFNEVKTLEIRLDELYDHVDYFVIVEGDVGFSGIRKEYVFPQYAHLFEKYKNKIKYFPLKEKTPFPNAYARSNDQKNSVYLGLINCTPNDIIIFSDLDEIPSAEAVELLKMTLLSNEIVCFQQKLYRGCYNRRGNPVRDPDWMGSLGITYRALMKFGLGSLNMLREQICFAGVRSFPEQELQVRVIQGGWHFTSIGSFEQYLAKMNNWEHFENPCPKTPEGRRAEVVSLHICEEIDSSFPKYIQEHAEELFQEGYLDDSDEY